MGTIRGWWRRIRDALRSPAELALELQVDALKVRLADAHRRMQEMYWDEQARGMAKARIAALEEATYQLASGVLALCPTQEVKPGCLCQAVFGTMQALGLNPEPEQIMAEVNRIREAARAKGPAAEFPLEGDGGCVFHGPDPVGFCRTHNRQCLTPEQYGRLVSGKGGAA